MGFGYSGPDHNEALITEQLPRRNRLAFTSHGQPSSLGNIVAISYDCGIPVGRDYDFGAPAAVPLPIAEPAVIQDHPVPARA